MTLHPKGLNLLTFVHAYEKHYGRLSLERSLGEMLMHANIKWTPSDKPEETWLLNKSNYNKLTSVNTDNGHDHSTVFVEGLPLSFGRRKLEDLMKKFGPVGAMNFHR
eukprot:UN04591